MRTVDGFVSQAPHPPRYSANLTPSSSTVSHSLPEKIRWSSIFTKSRLRLALRRCQIGAELQSDASSLGVGLQQGHTLACDSLYNVLAFLIVQHLASSTHANERHCVQSQERCAILKTCGARYRPQLDFMEASIPKQRLKWSRFSEAVPLIHDRT